MSFRPGSSSGNKKHGKRRTCPPQPAMFMLHSPVPIATSPLRAAGKDNNTKSAVLPSNEQDAIKETKVDITATATATNNSSSSNTKDETVQDKKPAAVTTDMPSDAPIPSSNQDGTTAAHAAASDNDNDNDNDDDDHDSITGEMNGTIKKNKASSSSPGDSTDKTSKKDSHQETTSLPNNSQSAEEAGIKIVAAANNSDSDNEEEDDDDDDDDDENPKSTNTSFPRTAIKRPRNSASAIAYAKKMREREEADTKKKEVELEGIKRRERVRRGAKAEKETQGEEGLEEKKGSDKGKSERRDESKGVPVGQDGGKEESGTKKSTNEKDSKSSTPSSPSAPASPTVDSSGKKRRPKRARMSSTPSSKPSQEANDDNDDGEKKTDGKVDKKDPENDVVSTAPAASSTRSTSRRGSKRVAAAIAAATSESTGKKSREEPKSAKKAKKSAKNKTEAHGNGDGHGHGDGHEESTKTPTTPSSSTRRSTRSRTSTVTSTVTSLPDKVASVELQRGRKRLPTRKVIEAMDYDALVASGSEDSVEVASKKTATKPKAKAKAKAATAAAAKPDKVTSKSTIATPIRRPGAEHTWKTRMVLLRAHHATYGTCDLNAGEEKPDHLLKNFVSEMRKQYRKFSKGESSQLTPAKVQELLDLEFDFFPNESGAARANTRKRNQKVWDEHFANLEKYYKEHVDCLVPCVVGEHYVLANWVRGQRKLYKRVGREAFDQDHLRRLEALGFDFTPMQSGAYIKKKIETLRPKVEATWNKWFSLLLKFKEENGHLMVSPKDDGYPHLYDWIHCQRKDYKKFQAGEKSSMCDEWIKRMNAINFDWAPMQSEDYGALLKLRLANSERYIEAWNDSYQKLKKFHKKQGNCYVFRGVHDEQLANWIHCQRKLKKIYDSGKHCALTEERINLLNEIDFDWSPSQSGAILKMRQAEFDKEWEGTFKLLCAYKKKTGHCTPKKTYPKLGCWTQRMRKLYAQNQEGHTTTLTKEKIAKLESIDFEFVKE